MVKLDLVKRECVATSIHITVRCTAGSGVYIDGLEVSASAAGIAMNNEAFAQNVDWKNTSTGNALLDATISAKLDAYASYEVKEMRTTTMGNLSETTVLSIKQVSLAGWLAAHVSAANATSYLANYKSTKYNTYAVMDGSSSTHMDVSTRPLTKDEEKRLTQSGTVYTPVNASKQMAVYFSAAIAGWTAHYFNNNPFPKPWYTGRPTSMMPLGGGNNNGNDDWMKWVAGSGFAGGTAYFKFKHDQFQHRKLYQVITPPQDNTYVKPPIIKPSYGY